MSKYRLVCSECNHAYDTEDWEDFQDELGWHMAVGHRDRECLLYAIRGGIFWQMALVKLEEHVSPEQRAHLEAWDAQIASIGHG